MCMIASGKSLTDIAHQMSLSVKTVSVYRARVLEKMRLKNNAELTHYAIKQPARTIVIGCFHRRGRPPGRSSNPRRRRRRSDAPQGNAPGDRYCGCRGPTGSLPVISLKTRATRL